MSFDNLEGTGDDAEKDEIQAPEKDNYLETVLLDYKGESEQNGTPEKAAESRNVEVQPIVGFTTKQVTSFLIAQHGLKDILLLFIR